MGFSITIIFKSGEEKHYETAYGLRITDINGLDSGSMPIIPEYLEFECTDEGYTNKSVKIFIKSIAGYEIQYNYDTM